MKSDKGQAAIEYMAVFGLALILSTPFIIKAQSSMMDLSMGSEIVGMQKSLDKFETSVKTVSAAGEPAQRTFFMDIPSNVESARIRDNRSVVYKVRTRSGESDLIRSFESNITGEVPVTQGKHRVTVYFNNSRTYVEVLS